MALGQFDFGIAACRESDSFPQQSAQRGAVLVGEVPSGLVSLEIQLRSSEAIFVVMNSGSVYCNHRMAEGSECLIDDDGATVTVRFEYSGFQRWVWFRDCISSLKQRKCMQAQNFACGYALGFAAVTYSLSGRNNCSNVALVIGLSRNVKYSCIGHCRRGRSSAGHQRPIHFDWAAQLIY